MAVTQRSHMILWQIDVLFDVAMICNSAMTTFIEMFVPRLLCNSCIPTSLEQWTEHSQGLNDSSVIGGKQDVYSLFD